MKPLGPAVLTGLMVREHKHFVDTVDHVPSMRDLAVTDPTCQAWHADFAPAPAAGEESGLG